MKNIILLLVFFFSVHNILAQSFKIHSHNDYAQPVPFWDAYANQLNSIEVDVFLKDDTLYVTHDEKDIVPGRTLQNLYLNPLMQAMALNFGEQKKLQLLIDIKSEYKNTLRQLVLVLEQYPMITDLDKIAIVISGNRPPIKEYTTYPKYIQFDYQSLEDIESKKIWDKIALISLSFKNFSNWNGKGRLTKDDLEKIKEVVQKAHSYNKPFRFWATPDSKTAWKAFVDLGVDFINTDMPKESSLYLKTLEHRNYYNETVSEVYNPTFKSDKKKSRVNNIILMIGDGNGLAQISAATLANGGSLTLTQLKSIGLLKTQSADDFTTDSAAGATALATGTKTNNRAIGVGPQDEKLTSIGEILHENGRITGFITTDHITGATPASFYAHRKDRSDVDGIVSDLLQSKLSLVIGGGSPIIEKEISKLGFQIMGNTGAIAESDDERVAHFFSYGDVKSIREGRGNNLAKSTKDALTFLSAKNTPFLLMVEAAKIDSYGHLNDVGGIITEGIDFDRAITEAIKFADSNEDTLVIITADHETSGFSIPQGNMMERSIEGDFTTDDHTGIMVPIFAYGPRSDEFQGVYQNTEVFGKLLEAMELKKRE
ncbi:alkaline phosphatase [Maribacter sp. 4G9]|uniref:alkaline phosphatase n=1 Tax=Maribacter sp. 4G9 TaxID=1889777 RepID=UPI000C14993D|nr:alkaline phosphatase [Maribacter sp. 4G9]PIB30570.1 alkaline phosphatase [Maribacter sp. 4G9]